MKRTRQEAFDVVWRWFVVDGHGQSVGSDNMCLYFGPAGARCAFGSLLPDGAKIREAKAVEDLTQREFSLSGLGPRDLVFAEELQRCHDQAISLSDPGAFGGWMRANLELLANMFKLTVPA